MVLPDLVVTKQWPEQANSVDDLGLAVIPLLQQNSFALRGAGEPSGTLILRVQGVTSPPSCHSTSDYQIKVTALVQKVRLNDPRPPRKCPLLLYLNQGREVGRVHGSFPLIFKCLALAAEVADQSPGRARCMQRLPSKSASHKTTNYP